MSRMTGADQADTHGSDHTAQDCTPSGRRFAGSTIAVVGCEGAIGRAVVAGLGAEGATVLGFDLNIDPAHLPPGIAAGAPLNLLDLNAHLRGFDEVVSAHADELRGLIVASGMYPARLLADETEDSLTQLFRINSITPVLVCESYLRSISGSTRARDGGQSLVLTSSLAARRARIGTAAYAASKAALARFVESLALEHRDTGVRVNSIEPGYVSSHSRLNPIPPSYEEKIASAGPLVVPDDLVDIYLWLLHESSGLLSGEHLAVDRGMRLGRMDESAWLNG